MNSSVSTGGIGHAVVTLEIPQRQRRLADEKIEQHLADEPRAQQQTQPHPPFGHCLGGGTDKDEFGELGLLGGHDGVGSRQRGGDTDCALGALACEVGHERRIQGPRIDK